MRIRRPSHTTIHAINRALDTALAGWFPSRCGRSRSGVERRGREHLRRSVGEEHGMNRRAVELEEIQPLDIMEGVDADLVLLRRPN
jgi:hypothetical protein